ncbi:MAG: hypothetical protein LBS05_05880 [Tannerellaceae bacterium]|jgi:hypothetical protein|nr:hypothetical protein [Tannerellaceae bacterium]
MKKKGKVGKRPHVIPNKGATNLNIDNMNNNNMNMDNRSEYLQFNRREEDNKHTISIERPPLKDGDILKSTEKLIKDVFKGHPAAYYDNNEKNTNPELAKKFYNQYYNEADIKREGAPERIGIEAFMEDVFLDKQNANKNKISFLLGNVGVGKTAFINYLISKKFSKYKDKLIFIRIDVENQENETTESIASYIIVKFIAIVRKNFDQLLTNDRTLNSYIDTLERIDKNSKEERKSNFSRIITYIHDKHDMKLALLIDNIDFIYHKSKLNFFDIEENREVTKQIDDLVKFFVKNLDEYFDSLYANMLFVMRKDTFEYIKSKNMGVGTSHVNVYTTCDPYIIKEYKWDDILSKRFTMLNDLIDTQYDDEKKGKIKEHITKIANYLEPNTGETERSINLIATIQRLTNFGLREMMEYLNNYSYISYFNTARFLKNEPVGLMAFILHGYQLYSDHRSVITNVFMNYNAEHFKPITYWLKYFIIKFIDIRTSKNIETTIEDIYDTFSTTGKDKIYEKKYIDMILKTLTDSNQSNIIEVKKTYIRDESDKLTLKTSIKGATIINEMVFKFYYLQLMIDDNLLPLPDILHQADFYKLNQSIGYSYLLFQGEEYSSTARKLIKEKGRSVIYFLTLLKTALEYEKNKYSDVYDNLDMLKIELPNMEDIIKNIKGELKAINSGGTISAFTSNIEAYFAGIDDERAKIETKIQSIFNI